MLEAIPQRIKDRAQGEEPGIIQTLLLMDIYRTLEVIKEMV
jgi:hypothetical protein